ncbi:MAG: phosphoenolpyruvate mutase [Thermoanaerobaculia bacterium]
MNKTTRFKRLLTSTKLELICEAHSGLSAKIVEEAGFPGIWGSGLTISSQLGVRDNNEASWTQVLDVLEFMADATTVPILMDGDTGFGNFNNVQRLVRKLEQRSIAAVCLEDKLFPKTNSFLEGRRQQLAEIDEFSGKIKAAKDAQSDPDFCVVARTEAFIAGWGLVEALRRAEAYRNAGADAILIHSALSSPDEVLAFKSEWGDRCPVVIVPTKYYSTPTDVFRERGFSMVIWANHILRGAIAAMTRVAKTIAADQSTLRVEDDIAPISDVFRLQGATALRDLEERYLPRGANPPAAVILAAGRGEELGDLTLDRPKAMVLVGGAPLLSHIVSSYNSAGIRRIVVVRGYKKETVAVPGITCADNDDFETTGELVSLRAGLAIRPDRDNDVDNGVANGADNGVIVSYGDVLFRKYIVDLLLETQDDLAVVIDTHWRDSANRNRVADYVRCSLPYSRQNYNRPVFLKEIGPAIDPEKIDGESMGFLKIGPRALPAVVAVLDELLADPANRKANMPRLIGELISRGSSVRAVYTSGNWCDVDSLEDVVNAGLL